MADKHKPSDEDRALFRDSVGNIRRLRQDRVPPHRRRTPPIPRKGPGDEAREPRDAMSLDFDPAEIEPGEALFFARPGVQQGLLRKLRRGRIAVGAELDLHGLTVAEAHRALADFLAGCHDRDVRCARIVHGKGRSSPGRRPVLKARLNTWLRQHDDVLAFCSAPPGDGGTGAAYVLLKKRR